MIHVLTGSTAFVPSAASIIQIPGTSSGTGGGGTTPPAQVTGLTANAASSTQVNLSWTANPTTDNVTRYNGYRITTAGFTVNTATNTPIDRPTTNSYGDTGLTASATYYYRVAAAVNSAGIGTPSDIASATTPAGIGTDTTPSTVSSTTPANGATGVATNTAVTIIANEQIQASTRTWQNIAFTNAAGASIDRQMSLATDNRTCTVQLVGSLALARNTRFTVKVLTRVRDLA